MATETEKLMMDLEKYLAEEWAAEVQETFSPHNHDVIDRPDLCASLIDSFGQQRYPTAALLTRVRQQIAA